MSVQTKGNMQTDLLLAEFGLIFKFNKIEEMKRNTERKQD